MPSPGAERYNAFPALALVSIRPHSFSCGRALALGVEISVGELYHKNTRICIFQRAAKWCYRFIDSVKKEKNVVQAVTVPTSSSDRSPLYNTLSPALATRLADFGDTAL
jgi:hypothetical protein